MKLLKPKPNETFTISSVPEWPSVQFETDGTGAHVWNWTIRGGSFTKSGKETTAGNKWDAQASIANCGGTLTVRAEAKKAVAIITVKIKGENPSSGNVTKYLATKPTSGGFEKIIEHESKFKHFNVSGEPIKSFDNGYGMCQLTTPIPTIEQAWNWQRNVDGGLQLFEAKRIAAIAFLAQSGRPYTADQVKYETVCRWNGGSYHQWDATAKSWVRPSHILCDTKTGNIGWEMNESENKGKTETELHARDSSSFSSPPGPGAKWKYLGVCYADRILG